MPFGASISCVHYQRFSNALCHILSVKTGSKTITNYLDDFLFISYLRCLCNAIIRKFIQLCKQIGVPIAEEKTEWAKTVLVFLGILLNGKQLTLSIPLEKQQKALHHHVSIDREFKFDCQIWKTFLVHYSDIAVCCPMVDLDATITAHELFFYSDVSASEVLGLGAVFNKHWLFARWENNYIKHCKPSIEYLELYALVAALLTWVEEIHNIRMVLFCNNSAVVTMINKLSSGCRNCMYLLRLLTLNNLVNNRRVFAKHVRSEDNYLADSLSRLQMDRFW